MPLGLNVATLKSFRLGFRVAREMCERELIGKRATSGIIRHLTDFRLDIGDD